MWSTKLEAEVRQLQHAIATQLSRQQAAVAQKRESRHALMHEVKNVLTGILACAEALSRDDLEPPEREEFLRLIASELDRIVGLTQQLADLAAGRQQPLQIQQCTVGEFFADLLPLIRPMLACHRIALICDLRYAGFWYIDPEQMRTAALNLVYNARDAMPNGGVLTIASRRERDQLILEFTDTGCGMAPELLARFLEPFVTAGKPHGTGLGMAIVTEIVKAHHAQIDVRSAVGAGATIALGFPLHPSPTHR